jgi:uncharacterized integral membrane protein
MAKYKKVGEGKVEVYEKQKTDWSAILGGAFIVFILLVVIFGGK